MRTFLGHRGTREEAVKQRTMNVANLIAFFIEHGRQWIRVQRDAHRPTAQPIPEAPHRLFESFFRADLLAKARYKWVPIINNPLFFAKVRAMGLPDPIDFSQMSGITFNDTILLSQARQVPDTELLPLMFHELVHVVQYDVLGIDEFVDRYVKGWAENGFDYFSIPLERMASDLADRFASNPGAPFSVKDEVERHL